MMGKLDENRPRMVRSAKRCSSKSKVENVSLVLLGGLLVVIGMMLRG
ncbi:hypothetical protein [Pelosinus sp. sgz500959]